MAVFAGPTATRQSAPGRSRRRARAPGRLLPDARRMESAPRKQETQRPLTQRTNAALCRHQPTRFGAQSPSDGPWPRRAPQCPPPKRQPGSSRPPSRGAGRQYLPDAGKPRVCSTTPKWHNQTLAARPGVLLTEEISQVDPTHLEACAPHRRPWQAPRAPALAVPCTPHASMLAARRRRWTCEISARKWARGERRLTRARARQH